jgi:TatD DNase family protein
MILPLDTHAHIEPDIAAAELAGLRSCVVAVTRTLSEYAQTLERSDRSVVWGAGCHPRLAREVKNFTESQMKDAIATTPVIGEVGLDGAGRTPMESQLTVLRGILRVASDTPRLLSVHSYRATELVVKELREFRPDAAILHWWLGSPAETEAAVEAGAYFSVNAAQARSWKSLSLVPLDRLLLETDHPFGDRSEASPRRPGNLTKSEIAVSAAFGISPDALRRRTWRNLKEISEKLNLVEMFPREFQVQFLAVR